MMVIRFPPISSPSSSQAHRHRQVKVADRDAVLFVVAAQPSGHARNERIVQRTAAVVAGVPKLRERDLEHAEPADQAALRHQRRAPSGSPGAWSGRPTQPARRPTTRCPPAAGCPGNQLRSHLQGAHQRVHRARGRRTARCRGSRPAMAVGAPRAVPPPVRAARDLGHRIGSSRSGRRRCRRSARDGT